MARHEHGVLNRPIAETPIAIFDFETTGLNAGADSSSYSIHFDIAFLQYERSRLGLLPHLFLMYKRPLLDMSKLKSYKLLESHGLTHFRIYQKELICRY